MQDLPGPGQAGSDIADPMAADAVGWTAPAKVNLALHVVGRRADGYHLIDTLVAFTRFGDTVSISPAHADSFEIDGPYATALADDGQNLVTRARDLLRARFADNAAPVAIRLTKRLPVASGIGGGSSDAAAALKGLVAQWRLKLSPDDLAALALQLGADLPMCLAARPLRARGIGEEIANVDGAEPLGIVLVHPGIAVSTPAVFAALEKRDNPPLPPLPARIDFHGLRNWLDATRNDLEMPARAIAPAISYALKALDRAGSGFSRMSGSGATCFGIFETGNVAKRAAAEIRARQPGWFVAATRTIGSEDA